MNRHHVSRVLFLSKQQNQGTYNDHCIDPEAEAVKIHRRIIGIEKQDSPNHKETDASYFLLDCHDIFPVPIDIKILA